MRNTKTGILQFDPDITKLNEHFKKQSESQEQGVHQCFWRTRRADFGYYKQDQTRNPRTCCEYCFQKSE